MLHCATMPSMKADDETIMCALQERLLQKIETQGTGPFLAAIFNGDGERLAEMPNTVVRDNCSHNHAEMNAIRSLEVRLGTFDLGPLNLTLYTTSEPCMMCMGGILWSGIKRVVFGVESGDVERITGFDEGFKPRWREEFARRGIEVVGPVAAAKGREVLSRYMEMKGRIYKPS